MMKINKSLYDWCKENNNEKLLDEWYQEKNIILAQDVSYASNYELGSDIADFCFVYDNLYEHKVLHYAIIELLKFILIHPLILPIDINIERDKTEILSNIYKIEDESLEKTNPELAKEWHPTKNGGVKPTMFKPYSGYKVWWLCPDCCFEYQATIGCRSRGTGCPKCGIAKSPKAKSKKVAMIDLKTGKILKVFESISDSGRQTKNSTGNIVAVCKGTRKYAGGYFWKYFDSTENETV